MTKRNEQEKFWTETYSKEYIRKNINFDNTLLIEGWTKMLKNIDVPSSILK